MPLNPNHYGNNGRFHIGFGGIGDSVFPDGDAVVAFGARGYVLGLALNEFHTYRYENHDRQHYCFWVNGKEILCGLRPDEWPDNGYDRIQFGGGPGGPPWSSDSAMEWDYIRFGTVGFGEQVIATDPPMGMLAGRTHGALDRFAVTFDAPNFVYLDQITVETVAIAGGSAPLSPPSVIAVRRRDDDPLETMELVLDGPLPLDATTTFIIDDGSGAPENVISYSLRVGDANGDGMIDAIDLPDVLTCLQGPDWPVGPDCRFADYDDDDCVTLADFAEFQRLFTGGQ
jgi:hypothetical protein